MLATFSDLSVSITGNLFYCLQISGKQRLTVTSASNTSINPALILCSYFPGMFHRSEFILILLSGVLKYRIFYTQELIMTRSYNALYI
jgi:hypothetical protein